MTKKIYLETLKKCTGSVHLPLLLVKKNFIRLKDFRNFDVLLLLTNSSRRKFVFNLAQTWLWCKTMAIMADDRSTI